MDAGVAFDGAAGGGVEDVAARFIEHAVGRRIDHARVGGGHVADAGHRIDAVGAGRVVHIDVAGRVDDDVAARRIEGVDARADHAIARGADLAGLGDHDVAAERLGPDAHLPAAVDRSRRRVGDGDRSAAERLAQDAVELLAVDGGGVADGDRARTCAVALDAGRIRTADIDARPVGVDRDRAGVVGPFDEGVDAVVERRT